MEHQLSNSKTCEKLTNYFEEIQKYLDTTPTYSIVESRKSLEYICKSIFGLENLKIPVNKKGYSTIASLIYHLNKKKIIDSNTHSTMQVIRSNGNEASHDSEIAATRDAAYLVHQHLSRLIIWFTEKYGLKNCKVCTLATNQRNSFVQKQKTITTVASIGSAEKFLKLSTKMGQLNKIGIIRILNELRTDRYVQEKVKGLRILPFIGAGAVVGPPALIAAPFAAMIAAPLALIAAPLAAKKIDKNTIDDLKNYLKVKYDLTDPK